MKSKQFINHLFDETRNEVNRLSNNLIKNNLVRTDDFVNIKKVMANFY